MMDVLSGFVESVLLTMVRLPGHATFFSATKSLLAFLPFSSLESASATEVGAQSPFFLKSLRMEVILEPSDLTVDRALRMSCTGARARPKH